MGTAKLGTFIKCTVEGSNRSADKLHLKILYLYEAPTAQQARDLIQTDSSREGLEIYSNDEIERKLKSGNQTI